MSETGRVENPLISNEKLKQIYRTMVHARLFEQHLMELQRKCKASVRLASIFGQEACRASTLIELTSGDLISDRMTNPVVDLILGVPVRAVTRETLSNWGNGPKKAIPRDHLARQIPSIVDGAQRLDLALGAALSLKLLKRDNIVLAYVYQNEFSGAIWKKVLSLARKLELPIIFVVLPSQSKRTGSKMTVCDKARSAGVPGIPVDLADAVALFRVVQESLGRTRGGDGPVVLECLAAQTAGQNDPVARMRQFLLERGVCTQRWIDTIERSFENQLTF